MVWNILTSTLQLFWRRMGLLLLANMLWLGLSLLVIPWPAATAGLFYLAQRVAEEELAAHPRAAVIGDFWVGFKAHWQRSSILAVGDLLCALVIIAALLFYGQSSVAPLRWLIGPIGLVGLAWAGVQIYLYPLLIQRAGAPPLALAREAFFMAIGYPLNTFSLLLTGLIVTAAATILAGPVLLLLFAWLALFQTMALRSVLAQRGEIVLKLTPEQRDARERKRE